ncbi:MAG: cation:proton antiporter [Lacipirellulaceae bacterium]
MELALSPTVTWSLVVGASFLLAALAYGPIKSLPISMPLCYLAIGIGIGPWGLKLIELDFLEDSKLVEVLAEIAVLVCLLTSGLKLPPLGQLFRATAVPLATAGMVVTIVGIAIAGYYGMGLPIGAAILLGAVLAPTDPVLAGEVQVNSNEDTDRLRYSLTGEAGLNDGAAFPFIMLGLGLLGVHDLGALAWKWLAVDLLYATIAGTLTGWIAGYGVSRLAVYVKRKSERPATCEELLTLGLIGVSYGCAMAIGSYGFLSVFAAGVALRHYAREDDSDDHPEETLRDVASINGQFERILEAAMVVLTGVLLASAWSLPSDWWIALLLFVVVRPLAVTVALAKSDATWFQKSLVAFFGLRGVGSLYYLSYAIGKMQSDELSQRLSEIVLTTIVLSIVLHTTTSSIILSFYNESNRQKGDPAA